MICPIVSILSMQYNSIELDKAGICEMGKICRFHYSLRSYNNFYLWCEWTSILQMHFRNLNIFLHLSNVMYRFIWSIPLCFARYLKRDHTVQKTHNSFYF